MGKLKGWALGGDTAAADRSWGFSSPRAPEAGRGKRAAAGPGPQQAAGRPPLSISVIPLAI